MVVLFWTDGKQQTIVIDIVLILFVCVSYQLQHQHFPTFISPYYRSTKKDKFFAITYFEGSIKDHGVGFGDSFCRTVWGVCLSWCCIDSFSPLAAKLIGPWMRRQFFKNVDFSVTYPLTFSQIYISLLQKYKKG